MMVECLRTKDVKELLVASSWRHLAPEGGSYGFGDTRAMLPVIDDFSSRPFIPREPLEMIKSGNYSQVPLVMGYSKDEHLIYKFIFLSDPSILERISGDW